MSHQPENVRGEILTVKLAQPFCQQKIFSTLLVAPNLCTSTILNSPSNTVQKSSQVSTAALGCFPSLLPFLTLSEFKHTVSCCSHKSFELLTLSGEVYSRNQVGESLMMLLSERHHKFTRSYQVQARCLQKHIHQTNCAICFGGLR